MSKFKVGDKVRCVDNYNYHNHLTEGKVYVVVEKSNGGYVRIKPDNDIDVGGYCDYRFELVQRPLVLTPEEVFEHLRKGTKLQVRHNNIKCCWYDVINPELITYQEMLTNEWRIKPEPEIIELNGKKYREIVE